MKQTILLFVLVVLFSSCKENYSNGERIGFLTKFSQKGVWNKSWEGELNVTQTGLNTSNLFEFSIDNDNEPIGIVKTLDSAANLGWKVKLVYHETFGKNWFQNRGETDDFVKEVVVLDRSNKFSGNNVANEITGNMPQRSGRIIDTIYVVIDRSK